MSVRAVVRTVGLVVLGAGLAGCQSFLPRDDTPIRPAPFPVAVEPGPSSQRLDEDGYPMIGAYPTAATAQADAATVSDAQARFAGGRRPTPNTGAYEARIAELTARREAARAGAGTPSTQGADETRAAGARAREARP